MPTLVVASRAFVCPAADTRAVLPALPRATRRRAALAAGEQRWCRPASA